MAKIRSINIGEKKGGGKRPVPEARLLVDWGIKGDGHGGPGARQVSLLAWESTLRMRESGADVGSGSFGENLTLEGIDTLALKEGDRLRVGTEALLEVTRLGKNCPEPCAIYYQAGYCIMPEEGVFCRVLEGGSVRRGDPVAVTAVSPEGEKE